MVRNRIHDTHPDNSLHADGFDDFRAGSLAQDVVMRERLEAQDAYKRQILEQITARQFAENMAGIHDKPGIGLGTLISGLMTATGHPPTPEQAKMLMALDGGTAAAASSEKQPYSYAGSAVDLDSLLGAGEGKAGITMPRTAFGNATENMLAFIGKYEASGSFDAVYGSARTPKPLTQMTVGDVLEWQEHRIANGAKSSAVGMLQFKHSTLEGLVNKLDIDPDTKFTPQLQMQLGHQLMIQRGLNTYLSGNISADTFQRNLSKEWAALPKDESGLSYYHGQNGNRAHADVNDMKQHLAALRGPVLALN